MDILQKHLQEMEINSPSPSLDDGTGKMLSIIIDNLRGRGIRRGRKIIKKEDDSLISDDITSKLTYVDENIKNNELYDGEDELFEAKVLNERFQLDYDDAIEDKAVRLMHAYLDAAKERFSIDIGLKVYEKAKALKEEFALDNLMEKLTESIYENIIQKGIEEAKAGLFHHTARKTYLDALYFEEYAGIGDNEKLEELSYAIVEGFIDRGIASAKKSLFHSSMKDYQEAMISIGKYGIDEPEKISSLRKLLHIEAYGSQSITTISSMKSFT